MHAYKHIHQPISLLFIRYSICHSYFHSSTRSFIVSFMHCCIHFLLFHFNSFHFSFHSFNHSFIHSVSQSFILSFFHSFVLSLIHFIHFHFISFPFIHFIRSCHFISFRLMSFHFISCFPSFLPPSMPSLIHSLTCSWIFFSCFIFWFCNDVQCQCLLCFPFHFTSFHITSVHVLCVSFFKFMSSSYCILISIFHVHLIPSHFIPSTCSFQTPFSLLISFHPTSSSLISFHFFSFHPCIQTRISNKCSHKQHHTPT